MDITRLKRTNFGYFLADIAAEDPGRLAMIDLWGGTERRTTYGEFDARMNRVAAMLTARGLKPGDRMILSAGNRTEFVEAMFGAMRAGIVPVPFNTRQGAAVLDYVAENSGARGAIVEASVNPAVAEIVERRGLSVRIALGDAQEGWDGYEDALAGADADFSPPEIDPKNHLCFLGYTSGSTGRPKGVPLTHEGQIWWTRCMCTYWPAGSELRTIAAMPLYHKNAMAGAIKPRLWSGGSVVLLPDFKPRPFIKALAEYRCTGAGGVPTVFALLLEEKDLIADLDFSALQIMVVGSAPVHEELMNRLAETFGVTVIQSYGLTEGGPVMLGPPPDGRPVPYDSAGAAWPEGEVKLVGADGQDHDSYGELWVRNPGVISGYYNLPEVNRQRIVDGWLRTGDLFARDAEGFYYFKGRTDDMFNCGGENVYPKEVENLLLTHPDAVEACVVAVPHATKGHAPVAMVAVTEGSKANEAALRAFCLEHGPAYSHPRRVVVVDKVPLTGAGKIDRAGITKTLTERFGTLTSDR
jgi:long-chain acyl-CoA synthetase